VAVRLARSASAPSVGVGVSALVRFDPVRVPRQRPRPSGLLGREVDPVGVVGEALDVEAVELELQFDPIGSLVRTR